MNLHKKRIAATMLALMVGATALLTACNEKEGKIPSDETNINVEQNIIENEIIEPEIIDDIDDYKDFDFENPLDAMDMSLKERMELDVKDYRKDNSYGYVVAPYYKDEYKIHKYSAFGTFEDDERADQRIVSFAVLGCGEDSNAEDIGDHIFSSPYYGYVYETNDPMNPGKLATIYTNKVDEPVYQVSSQGFANIDSDSSYQPTEDICQFCDKCFDTTADIKNFKQYIEDNDIEMLYE